MAKAYGERGFRAGPRLLLLGIAGAVVVGVVMIYRGEGSQPNYLFFFFLPVAAASVVLGKTTGLLMAVMAVAATLIPAVWWGLGHVAPHSGSHVEAATTLTVWAVFLLAMSYLVGWVSEHGGSLSFAQGLGGQAIRAMELERRRTGQDIHDGIAQYAAAASIETQILADMTSETDSRTHAQVERIRQSLDLLVVEARSMVGNLRPPALGPADFNASMFTLVRGFESRTGVASDLELEGNFGLHTDSARICVYRIAQEALANVEQHTKATRVRVWARSGKGGVDLIVHDNGAGFDPDKLPSPNGEHFGLPGMRERAEYLGGRLVIRSSPGEGTSVVLHIPRYRGGGDGRD